MSWSDPGIPVTHSLKFTCFCNSFSVISADVDEFVMGLTPLQAKLQLDAMNDTDKMASCGCMVVCPNSTTETVGYMEGNFTSDVSNLVKIENVGDDITVTSSNGTIVSAFDTPTSVCAGDGSFYGNADTVRDIVDSSIASTLASKLSQSAMSYNVPVSIRLVDNYPIFVDYHSHNFTFTEEQTVTSLTSAVLRATLADGSNVTYVDDDHSTPPEASVRISI